MGDWPASHHHHSDDHLHIVRLAISAVAVLGETRWSCPLEVGTGDIVKHQVWLEAEQVAEAMIESDLDLFLGGHELIQRSIPGFQLLEVDADSVMLVPTGNKPPALAVTDEIGLQPTGQAMFTGRMDQAIGDQYERTIGERHSFGFAQRRIEDGPQTQLIEQGPNGQDRSPGGSIEDVEIFVFSVLPAAVAAQKSLEHGEYLRQEILAAQVGQGALLDLAVVAIGFDDPDIFVDRAVGGPDFDGSEVHAVNYHDKNERKQYEKPRTPEDISDCIVTTHFWKNRWPAVENPKKTRQNCANKPPVRAYSPQTWASGAWIPCTLPLFPTLTTPDPPSLITTGTRVACTSMVFEPVPAVSHNRLVFAYS